MLREALSYPTRKPNGPRSVLVGGGIVFVVSLFGLSTVLEGPLTYAALLGILPWVFLRGYYVRVVRTTIGRDRPTPPPFDDPGRLFRDGLASLLISTCYLLPAAVVLGPLAYTRGLGRDPATLFSAVGLPTALANAALSATDVLALFAVMYLLGSLYALPVAVARYAYTGTFRAAFGLRTVVSGALTEDYAVAWALSLLLQVVLFPFAYAFRALLVGFFLHFVVAAGVRYCYGQGVGSALRLEPVGPEWTGAAESTQPAGDALASPSAGVDAPSTGGVEVGVGGEGERT